MTINNPKFKGTPGPWLAVGHKHSDGITKYTIVSIFGDAVGNPPVAEVLQHTPSQISEQRIEANARLLASAPDLLTALESLVEIFDPDKQAIYSFAREKIEASKRIIKYVNQSNL